MDLLHDKVSKEYVYDVDGSLPQLRKGLEILRCDKVTEIDSDLPDTLLQLSCGKAKSITKLPSMLELLDADSLKVLPELPDTLTHLYCGSVRRLPNKLPSNLCVLYCDMVMELPKLPDTLILLQCNSVTKLPESLPSSLKELWCGIDIELPELLPKTLLRVNGKFILHI